MGTAVPMVRGHPLKLPFLLQAGHSELLVLSEVSASRKDTAPGLASLRAAEEARGLGEKRLFSWQAWQSWRSPRLKRAKEAHLIYATVYSCIFIYIYVLKRIE